MTLPPDHDLADILSRVAADILCEYLNTHGSEEDVVEHLILIGQPLVIALPSGTLYGYRTMRGDQLDARFIDKLTD